MSKSRGFYYVLIPADPDLTLMEHYLSYSDETETSCLTDRLKSYFQNCKGLHSSVIQSEILRSQLEEGLKKENCHREIDENMMNLLHEMQVVDIIALKPNAPVHQFVGVNMYVDDKAVSKGLPVNSRATSLAQLCGLTTEVRGDAFVAKVFENTKEEFKRLDFRLSECRSEAAWISEAKLFNTKKAQGLVRDGVFITPPILCANLGCYEKGTKTCSACLKTKYCSFRCQKEDWQRHKLDCKENKN
ncbi:uncharacterized protein LOC135143552 [Zophobas morio]|uniref:uncharacterized protein LOC135143552 n=1 Tax=Zophobas morio TaxID=2755281 RepID=UPI003083C0F1